MFKNRWEKVLKKVFMADDLANEMDAMLNPGVKENDSDLDGGVGDDDTEDNDQKGEGEEGNTETEETDDEEEDSEEDAEGDADEEDGEKDEDSADDTDNVPEIERLRSQNEELMKIVGSITKKEKPEAKEEKTIDLYESDEFKNLQKEFEWDDKEVAAFKLFQAKANEQSVNKAVEYLQKTAPGMINQTITNQQQLQNVRDTFYKDNPALSHIKPYVAQIASQIAKTKSDDVSIQEVLNEAAEKVYTVMGIDKDKFKGNEDNKTGKGKKPAFPKAKGSRKKTPKPTALEKEINEMIELDE